MDISPQTQSSLKQSPFRQNSLDWYKMDIIPLDIIFPRKNLSKHNPPQIQEMLPRPARGQYLVLSKARLSCYYYYYYYFSPWKIAKVSQKLVIASKKK